MSVLSVPAAIRSMSGSLSQKTPTIVSIWVQILSNTVCMEHLYKSPLSAPTTVASTTVPQRQLNRLQAGNMLVLVQFSESEVNLKRGRHVWMVVWMHWLRFDGSLLPGPPKTAVKNILIGLSFTLLIVYSVVILTLIILKKVKINKQIKNPFTLLFYFNYVKLTNHYKILF